MDLRKKKRAYLIRRYQLYCLRLASRLLPCVSTEDLISGLIGAIEKFNLSKNEQLKTYAGFRIKDAMLMTPNFGLGTEVGYGGGRGTRECLC